MSATLFIFIIMMTVLMKNKKQKLNFIRYSEGQKPV